MDFNVRVTNQKTGQPIEGAVVTINAYPANDFSAKSGAINPAYRYSDGGGLANFVANFAGFNPPLKVDVAVFAAGYAPWTTAATPINLASASVEVDATLVPFSRMPPVPTREQVCTVQLTFQGATITTQQYGTQPWFEPAYQTLTDPADRASVIEQKKALGDTHLILEFFTHRQSIYNEPGQPWQAAISPSMEENSDFFHTLVLEVIQAGLIPIVAFDGDNGDNVYDGYPNALRQLPILFHLLDGLHDRILYARLWDGVFYGSTPTNIQDFATAFRVFLPDGYLAIEFSTGHIPVGNGPTDYAPGGMMVGYDTILGEFDDNRFDDSVWQVLARMIGPLYVRPSNQPADDDPGSPFGLDSAKFYLRYGNPRGPFVFIVFEYFAYGWVRGTHVSEVQQARAYFARCGAPHIC